MKRLAKIVIVATLFFWAVGCSQQTNAQLQDGNGKTVGAAQLKGKWVIINYWATWCDACVGEIPELNKFYQNNQGKNVLLFGVNYDHLPLDELQKAAKAAHIQYPTLVTDPKIMLRLGDSDVIPVTYVINPKGKLVKKIVGPTSEQELTSLIQPQ